MADNDFTIILKAVDEATAPIKKFLSDASAGFQKLGKDGEEATKKLRQEITETNKELRELRKITFIAAGAFATLVATTREAAKYSVQAKKDYDGFATSISSISAMIGTSLSPALRGATTLINFLRDTIEAAIAGFIKLFSLIFESFGAIGSGLANIRDMIKNIFTGSEDPMGIIEGFRVSFAKAMDISNAAADQFLNKVETTRAAVEGGTTIEAKTKQFTDGKKKEADAVKSKETEEIALKTKTASAGRALLAQAAQDNKAFAIANAAVSIIETIINTATGVTKALSFANIPLAITIGAIGAAQTALIASQSFAVGTGNVPYDMTAQIHQGETIVPATFADAIRSGDLSLSGGGGFGGNFSINIQQVIINSGQDVRDFAETLGFEIDRKRNNGRTRV